MSRWPGGADSGASADVVAPDAVFGRAVAARGGQTRVSDSPVVIADRLTKRFGKVTAVADLNLEIRAGQIVGFLGPNGAGKTTTIRMLMGFLRPTAGHATILGAAAGDVAVRSRIGYLPGDLRVEPSMTGGQLFAWYGRLRQRHNQRRVDELTQRLGLDPSRRFDALSKGNRQKVGIVQALCHDPQVLILDEPTTGLDPLVQREFLALLAEAAQRGTAVLFSSHVLPEVERVASQVAIIRSGRLVTVATVDDLLDKARRRLELRFAAPVPADTFLGVPGVTEVQVDGRTAVLAVDGPVGPALRAATDSGTLLRVNPAGDDLEDLFVSLYRSDPGQRRIEVRQS
jgi:ABC-2 type transport system ATP-binding protein